MKRLNILAVAIIPLALSACGSLDAGGRYGGGSGLESSYAVTGDYPAAQRQSSGWLTSPQIREAEKKSLAQDMPFAVVDPAGTVR